MYISSFSVQGMEAYNHGLNVDEDNPYTFGTHEFFEWENGWYEAEELSEQILLDYLK